MRRRDLSVFAFLFVANPSWSSKESTRQHGQWRTSHYHVDTDDEESNSWLVGRGREFFIVGGAASSVPSKESTGKGFLQTGWSSRETFQASRGATRLGDWWEKRVLSTLKNLPKVQCRLEPMTTLKIRKTFRPLRTIVRLSAHFNTQRGVWQFQSSWEEPILGGKLTIGRRELQLTKSWQLSVGPVEDLVTRLRLRAAVDLQSWKAYLRVGFRTERLSPINVVEGFTLFKQIPLDGPSGNVKLEVRANFALPEPEIEYSTETQRSLVGMGDIEVGIEELNLLLDF